MFTNNVLFLTISTVFLLSIASQTLLKLLPMLGLEKVSNSAFDMFIVGLHVEHFYVSPTATFESISFHKNRTTKNF